MTKKGFLVSTEYSAKPRTFQRALNNRSLHRWPRTELGFLGGVFNARPFLGTGICGRFIFLWSDTPALFIYLES
jgi:hypothetical protein